MHTTYGDIHERVDRLTPEQAEAIRSVLRQFPEPASRPAAEGTGPSGESGRTRWLSFAGIWHSGESDLAERSEDILRAEFNDAA